ncbi:MAG: DNA adenine methylase [Hyphomonadaceae bacterium]|nr:DNA adenine methylase [Hyphomonadaceae bacterium]
MAQPDLFNHDPAQEVPTESIKYIGSKLKIIPHIIDMVAPMNVKTVFDGFTGSTRVAQALARSGYSVFSCDIAVWSEIFSRCYLGARPGHPYDRLIDELNDVSPIDGWFTYHYGGCPNSPSGDGLKKPWQRKNTRKLDGIRRHIGKLGLEPHEEAVALTSLIIAMDKVDSTIGHFTSYLSEWAPRSYNDVVLSEPRYVFPKATCGHKRGDIFDVLEDVENIDLAYLDPPYGSNNEKMPPSRVRYASYYHLWTTIILNDEPPLFGKALRRTDTRDTVAATVFEEFRKSASGRFMAVEAIEKLLNRVPARHVLLSYSSGGRATFDELIEAMKSTGRLINIIGIDYRRNVMSGMRWTNHWIRADEGRNTEYLFLLEKL